MSCSICCEYRLTAERRAVMTTSLVVSGVTKGLPSRSPPIQEPKRNRLCSRGTLGMPMLLNAVSIRLWKTGRDAKIVSWKYDSPCLISSCTQAMKASDATAVMTGMLNYCARKVSVTPLLHIKLHNMMRLAARHVGQAQALSCLSLNSSLRYTRHELQADDAIICLMAKTQ